MKTKKEKAYEEAKDRRFIGLTVQCDPTNHNAPIMHANFARVVSIKATDGTRYIRWSVEAGPPVEIEGTAQNVLANTIASATAALIALNKEKLEIE